MSPSKRSTKKAAPIAAKQTVAVPPVEEKRKYKHPKFFEMISAAIIKLDERKGSSKQALLKYIVENYDVDSKLANRNLKLALKNGIRNGLIKQSTGIGASGSFKLASKRSKPVEVKPTIKNNIKINKKSKELSVKKVNNVKPKSSKIVAKSKKVVQIKKSKVAIKSKSNTKAVSKSRINNKTVRTRPNNLRNLK